MAPREQTHEVLLNDEYAPAAKAQPKLNDDWNVSHLAYPERIIFFRLGALRFGLHGCMGILSTILLSYSLFLVHFQKKEGEGRSIDVSLPFWLCLSIVASTLILAIGSYGLISQVPRSSKISWFIVPPHREAFKRTIATAIYLNIRLVHQFGWFDPMLTLLQDRLLRVGATTEFCTPPVPTVDRSVTDALHQKQQHCGSLAFSLGLFLFNLHYFFPRNSDFKNGNTWIFIIPMWIGLNIDTMHQFPSLLLGSSDTIPTSLLSGYSIAWERVNSWNDQIVDVPYLLLTLLCTVQVAFLFTLAFRGYVHIKTCYWIAATVVMLLFFRVIN